MQRLKFLFCFSLIFGITLPLLSQTGSISGRILDKKTMQPIPDANIVIESSGQGVTSGDGSFYVLKNVPTGKQILNVSVIGYHKAKIEITVSGSIHQDILLEPAEVWIDPVTVTATRTDHRQSQITVSTEILTPARLVEQTGATAGELVASVSGLIPNSADHLAGVSTPSLRGAGTEHVLVLLDDVPLNPAQGGGVDLNTIPADILDKIEIVRGGHSALYGASAVGGVIHLISKEVAQPGIFFGAQSTAGSFGLRSGTMHTGQLIGPFSWFMQYGQTQDDGNFKFKPPNSDETATRKNNDFISKNFFLKSNYQIGDRHRLQATYQRFYTRRGIAGQIPYLSPAARRRETRNLIALHSENQWTDRLRLTQKLFRETYDNHYLNPESWIPEDDLHQNTALGADLQAQYKVTQSLEMIAGAELHNDKLKSTRFSKQDRTTASSFGQIEMTRSILSGILLKLVPAVRYDHFSDVGDHTSPRLGLLLSAGQQEEITFRTNVGHAFRAPSFNDLYWPEDAYTKGNPNLKAETAVTMDAGFTVRKSGIIGWQLESTLFRNRFENLIQWSSNDGMIWSPENVGDAQILGWENALQCRLPGDQAYFKIAYTAMKSTDKTAGSATLEKDLIYHPHAKWDFSTGAKWFGFYVNLNYRIIGDRYADAANNRKLEAYSLMNANFGRNFKLRWIILKLRIEGINLTDQSIFMTEGYPSPGREVRFSVGVKH